MSKDELLSRIRKKAAEQGTGRLVDATLAATVLAQDKLPAVLMGLKLIKFQYGKATVRATLSALIDAALE